MTFPARVDHDGLGRIWNWGGQRGEGQDDVTDDKTKQTKHKAGFEACSSTGSRPNRGTLTNVVRTLRVFFPSF